MQEATHSIAGSRTLAVLVGGASAIVLIVGIQYFSGIIGPLFLALVLTIAGGYTGVLRGMPTDRRPLALVGASRGAVRA
jgi:hypothetical protein